jgi:molybdate transport system substrate-binding protein
MTRPARSAVAVSAAAAVLVALVLAACGGGDSGEGGSGSKPPLTVSAASSLKQAFTAYGREFPSAAVRFSFAGSDDLAAQIEQGVKPDVFASANTKLPDELFAKGLVRKPRVFAANRLVLAVPADSTRIRSLDDLAKPGTTLAIGSPTVPIGSYTRTVLARLPASRRQPILRAVRSEEPDVSGIVGKLTQGAVDAGFVYISDVRATDGRLRAIELPAGLQPAVSYGVAVVKGAEHPGAAARFVAGLLGGAGAKELRRAGFEPPPPA